MSIRNIMDNNSLKKIWIDLDNSPHVPFFAPIIKELKSRGFYVNITARDCFQVCGLCELYKLQYIKIGRHYGKNKIMKVIGTVVRSLRLLTFAAKERPLLAVSHGSRSQLLTASVLGIPVVVIFDYEYTKRLKLVKPDWAIAPEIIPENAIKLDKNRVFRYAGIKEDIYIPHFKQNNGILKKLDIKEEEILVTIRPPATVAHYHNPESEGLFAEAVNFLCAKKGVRIVILPRVEEEENNIRKKWQEYILKRKIIIPETVLNGMDLIWHSDLVISGGGTMSREAAAMNVPAFSIFKGKIGAVDKYLEENGRLTLLQTADDIPSKVVVKKRTRPDRLTGLNPLPFNQIIDYLTTLMENNN